MTRAIARRSLIVALATAPFAGCADLLVDSYRYGTVEVVARTRLGAPVEGVDLLLYRSEQHLGYGVTDAGGKYVFENVPFGNLGVFATLPGDYSSADLDHWIVVDGIQMDEGGKRTVPLELLRCNSTMSVSVVDDLGMAVPNTNVLVYRSDGASRNATTGTDGRAVISDVPCGNLGVTIAPPDGYATQPGLGGSYVDGLISRGGEEILVDFTVLRI